MLAQADFQRVLTQALGEFAPSWTLVGDCALVDRFDASHWGSGPQSFQVTLRHGVTGRLKVLGRRIAGEPGATVHPAVALSLIGAYRHGNSEPIRAYLAEIGVAANGTSDTNQIFHRSAVFSARAAAAEPALAVAAPVAAHAAGRSTTTVVGEAVVSGTDGRSLLPSRVRAPREVAPPAVPGPRPITPMPHTPEARTPMLGRLRRELQIWYWRRGASGKDKDKPHARD